MYVAWGREGGRAWCQRQMLLPSCLGDFPPHTLQHLHKHYRLHPVEEEATAVLELPGAPSGPGSAGASSAAAAAGTGTGAGAGGGVLQRVGPAIQVGVGMGAWRLCVPLAAAPCASR